MAEPAPEVDAASHSGTSAEQHSGPSSKEQLLQLEGLDDTDLPAGYIPSYFRRRPMPAHDEEESTLSLAMVQSMLRDLNVNGGHAGPTFVDVVTQQLAALQHLAATLGEDYLRYNVTFAPGTLPQALDSLIHRKEKAIAKLRLV
eukprot:EG_transcript_25662